MPVEFDELWSLYYPCPCGKGQYKVSLVGDHYGRQDLQAHIICSRCSYIYVAHNYRWVRRSRLQSLEALRNTINELQMQLNDGKTTADLEALTDELKDTEKLAQELRGRIDRESLRIDLRYPKRGEASS